MYSLPSLIRLLRALARYGEGQRRLRDGGGEAGTTSGTTDGPCRKPPLEHTFSPVVVELTFSLRGGVITVSIGSIRGGEPGSDEGTSIGMGREAGAGGAGS